MVNKSVIVSNFERGTDGASLEVIRLQDADYQLPAQQPAQQHCSVLNTQPLEHSSFELK